MSTPRPGFSGGTSAMAEAVLLIAQAADETSYPSAGLRDRVEAVLQRADASQVVACICACAGVLSRCADQPDGTGQTPREFLDAVTAVIAHDTARRQ